MSDMNLPPNTLLTPDKATEPESSSQQSPPATGPRPPVRTAATETPPPSTLAGRVIWYIGGAISILLAFRFVLALLGANAANGFAQFIYGVTTPLASPFFSLFGYTPIYGSSHLEVSTLVAIAVYALVAWGLVKLVTITRPTGQ